MLPEERPVAGSSLTPRTDTAVRHASRQYPPVHPAPGLSRPEKAGMTEQQGVRFPGGTMAESRPRWSVDR